MTGALNFHNFDLKVVLNCFGLCQICILVLENWLGGGIDGQLSYNCCGLCVSVVWGHAAERRRFFCHAAADFGIKRRRASLLKSSLKYDVSDQKGTQILIIKALNLRFITSSSQFWSVELWNDIMIIRCLCAESLMKHTLYLCFLNLSSPKMMTFWN